MAGMHTWGSFALELIASALAPPRCAACDTVVRRSLAAFCSTCASQIQRIENERGDAVAAFVYGGPVARALARFKYADRPELARPLGDLLFRAVEPWIAELGAVVVVPVPLHPSRLATRGFNQSALLARRLAARSGAAVAPRALARTVDTEPQASLDRRARASNVAGAFVVRRPSSVRGDSILLVDDVRTTGATLESCAAALLRAGARRVGWAVVAQAGEAADRA
jgi:ComF family protein